jgi:hypothetical protein
VQTFLSAWLNGSVILGYNNDLNRIAAGCSSGKPTTIYTVGYEDDDWIVYNVPVPAGSQFTAIEDVNTAWSLFPSLAGVTAMALGCKNSTRVAGRIRWVFEGGTFAEYNEPSLQFAPPAYLWLPPSVVSETAAKTLINLTTDYYQNIFWKAIDWEQYNFNIDNGAVPPATFTGVDGTFVLGYDRLDLLVKKP